MGYRSRAHDASPRGEEGKLVKLEPTCERVDRASAMVSIKIIFSIVSNVETDRDRGGEEGKGSRVELTRGAIVDHLLNFIV